VLIFLFCEISVEQLDVPYGVNLARELFVESYVVDLILLNLFLEVIVVEFIVENPSIFMHSIFERSAVH
jgi:hypothetical protein